MVIHNSSTKYWPVLCVAMGLTIAAPRGAVAATASGKSCAVHAAVMVAEMKASAAQPMSDQEIALVRETAMKSCLAQTSGNPNTDMTTQPAALTLPQATAAVAAAPHTKTDTSFFGTLGAILSGPTTRKPGNQRLLDRSQH